MSSPAPRAWWVRIVFAIVSALGWLFRRRDKDGKPGGRDKPASGPPASTPAALAALALAAAVALGPLAAAPVPVPDAIEGRGSRGLAELRDPSGASESLSRLLRSCTRCHSAAGPNRPLFEGSRPDRPLDRLRWGTDIVVRSGPEATWYPDGRERADLERALRLLGRK